MARTNFPRNKQTTTTRGYGTNHTTARRQHLAQLQRDGQGTCCICGHTITPDMNLHLDHTPDRTTYRGLAHATCNRKDGARRGRARQTTPQPWTNPNW